MTGTELKSALKRAHMTQEQLAERLGHTRALVSGWIKKDHVPEEWDRLVREVLDVEIPPSEELSLSRFSDVELLAELARRAKKSNRT